MSLGRQRFKPEERKAFQPGTKIEWLNASTWRPGEITGAIQRDSLDLPYVPVRDEGKTTRTFTAGQTVRGYPGHVRLTRPPEGSDV
jgi:hypothetical protein